MAVNNFIAICIEGRNLPLRRASGTNIFIGSSPKFIMEALGMTLIAALAFVMTKQEGRTYATWRYQCLAALALGSTAATS